MVQVQDRCRLCLIGLTVLRGSRAHDRGIEGCRCTHEDREGSTEQMRFMLSPEG